jgi:hypothetical protein
MSRLKPRPTRRQSVSRLWRLKPTRHTFDPRARALGYYLAPLFGARRIPSGTRSSALPPCAKVEQQNISQRNAERNRDRREKEALALLNGPRWLVACWQLTLRSFTVGLEFGLPFRMTRCASRPKPVEGTSNRQAGQHLKPHVRPDTHRRAGTCYD